MMQTEQEGLVLQGNYNGVQFFNELRRKGIKVTFTQELLFSSCFRSETNLIKTNNTSVSTSNSQNMKNIKFPQIDAYVSCLTTEFSFDMGTQSKFLHGQLKIKKKKKLPVLFFQSCNSAVYVEQII